MARKGEHIKLLIFWRGGQELLRKAATGLWEPEIMDRAVDKGELAEKGIIIAGR